MLFSPKWIGKWWIQSNSRRFMKSMCVHIIYYLLWMGTLRNMRHLRVKPSVEIPANSAMYRTVLVFISLIFPFHLKPSLGHLTGFCFYIFSSFLAQFLSCCRRTTTSHQPKFLHVCLDLELGEEGEGGGDCKACWEVCLVLGRHCDVRLCVYVFRGLAHCIFSTPS